MKQTNLLVSALLFSVGLVLVLVFLYFDRHNKLSLFIRSWGLFGIFAAIVLMATISMFPIPSEGILMMYFKTYGVFWGAAYAWIGTLVGTIVIFFVARNLGRPLLQTLMTDERVLQVEDWVLRKGAIGLLIVRFLPIPAFLVNYAAGMIKSVGFSDYLWTAGISILPYYAGTALVFLGVVDRLFS